MTNEIINEEEIIEEFDGADCIEYPAPRELEIEGLKELVNSEQKRLNIFMEHLISSIDAIQRDFQFFEAILNGEFEYIGQNEEQGSQWKKR